jgi:hypothetical protein
MVIQNRHRQASRNQAYFTDNKRINLFVPHIKRAGSSKHPIEKTHGKYATPDSGNHNGISVFQLVPCSASNAAAKTISGQVCAIPSSRHEGIRQQWLGVQSLL